LINPIVVKISHPEINFIEFCRNGVTSFSFISRTGPMWFALTLLIFSFGHLLIRPVFDKFVHKHPFSVNAKNILMLVVLITLTTFGIRLIFPIGTAVINLQFCFFVAYIFMFLSGIIAYQKNIFNTITFIKAKKWFVSAFAFGAPLWAIIVYFGIRQNNLSNSLALGGWNLLAFGYAFWESFFCVTIMIGLIGVFKKYYNTQNALQRFLSANAFGVYVFHPLILVFISVLLKNWHILPILKFIVVIGIAVPITFIFVFLIRKVKVLRAIIS
jgi:glucans biosynthesis protein C